MGMLFARRKTQKTEGVTTSEKLLPKEANKAESVRPIPAKNVPVQPKNGVAPQPKVKN